MFINEYVMNRKRYDKWATPKFWKKRMFFIYCFIFAAGIFGWIYFARVEAPARWKTVGAFLTFVAVYRGVFFDWMHADKTFRVTRQQYFNSKDWTCKVMISNDTRITLYINEKLNNTVEWLDIVKFEEAKTYFKLSGKDGVEGVMLDKECFTEGDAESFKQWMAKRHPEIEYARIAPMFDK